MSRLEISASDVYRLRGYWPVTKEAFRAAVLSLSLEEREEFIVDDPEDPDPRSASGSCAG